MNGLIIGVNSQSSTVVDTTYSLFLNQDLSSLSSGSDGDSITTGLKFQVNQTGFIRAIRFWKVAGQTDTRLVKLLLASNGSSLGQQTSTGETSSGWQQVNFTTPIAISATTNYIACVHSTPVGQYTSTNNWFVSSSTVGPITVGTGAGVYGYGNVTPTSSFQNGNYWIDIVFSLT